MSSLISHLTLGGLATAVFIYSSYYLYSLGKEKKENYLNLKKEKNSNDETPEPVKPSQSNDFGETEIKFLISNLTSNNLTFLLNIIITITKLAAFTKNHEILRSLKCIESLHDLIKREWKELKKINNLKLKISNSMSNISKDEIQDEKFIQKTSNNNLHEARNKIISQAFLALSNLAMNQTKLDSLNEILETCQDLLSHSGTPFFFTNHCLLFILNASAACGEEPSFKLITPFLNQNIFPPSIEFSSIPVSLSSSHPSPNPTIINSIRITINLSTHPTHTSDILQFKVPSHILDPNFLSTQHHDYVLRYISLIKSLTTHLLNHHARGFNPTVTKTLQDLILDKSIIEEQIKSFSVCMSGEYDDRINEVIQELEKIFQ